MISLLKGKLIAGFLLAFLAGGAAGAFFTFHQARHYRPDFGPHRHSLTERMRNRIKTQLDLTPEQLARIGPILDRASKELQEIRNETGSKVREVMADADRALQPELTSAQRAKLQKIQQKARDRKGPRRHRSPSDERDAASSTESTPGGESMGTENK